jgi:general secretion pathway protein H
MSTTSRPDPQGGFTLVEVLIVLAILALGAALALPVLATRAPGATLAAAAQEVRAALASARSAAIAGDREVTVGGGIGGYAIDGTRHDLAGAAAIRVEVSGGRLVFFPSGASSGGRVVLKAGRSARELDIEALSGRVHAAR